MENNNNEVMEKNGGGKRDLFLPISILGAAVVIAGAVLFTSLYKPGTSGQTAPGGAAGQQPAAPAVDASSLMKLGPRDAILGSANAPVTIIEYGDYQCPFCSRFFSQTEPLIIQDYVNTGKVKFVFRDLAFLGAESTAAAQAAQCAEDQNKLWAYHDALYNAKLEDQAKGGSEDDGSLNRTLFLKLANQVGLNIGTFTSCLDGNTDAAIVAQEKTTASAAGVNSTPAFLINGQEIMGAQPYTQSECQGQAGCTPFQPAIEAALKG